MEPLAHATPGGHVDATWLHRSEDLATMIVDRFTIVLWRGTTTPANNQLVEEAGLECLRRHPEGIGVIGIVDSYEVPDAEARRSSARVNDSLFQRGAVGFAGILPQQGFAGAWMRGVITGLVLLARYEYPFHVFATELDATRWLSGLLTARTGMPCDARACAEKIAELRREYALFSSERR